MSASKQDYALARQWYEKADQQGNAAAQSNFDSLNKSRQSTPQSSGGIPPWLLIVVILGILFGLRFYFSLAKCPECGKRKALELDAEEVDRWRGSKEVNDKDTDGRVIRTRTIAVDYAKIKIYWQCKECGEQFSTFKVREV